MHGLFRDFPQGWVNLIVVAWLLRAAEAQSRERSH
jgi:hypothetical protein